MKLDAKIEMNMAAQLAKMALAPGELEKLSEEWARAVPELQAVAKNAPDAAPMWYPHEGITPMREDTPEPSLERDELLSNAPNVEAGCFVVPRLVD